MAASDHLQPHQLSMFMSASEITSQYSPPHYERKKVYPEGEPSRLENDSEVFGRKLKESKSKDWDRLHADIKRNGVQEPIDVAEEPDPVSGRPAIGEGHHRLASMLALNPNQPLPVRHHGTINDVGSYIVDHGPVFPDD